MTATDTSTAEVSVRGNLVIGIASIAVGAVVIPYGAVMPNVRAGIPGPGLFPMMIGGLLIIIGALIILTTLLSARRERIHGEQLAAAEAGAPPVAAGGTAAASAATTDPSAEVSAPASTDPAADETSAAVPSAEGAGAGPVAAAAAEDGSAAAVPSDADDVPEDQVATEAVMDTDIGSDGIRRWINGAILMGGILFYVFFATILGFPVTMAIVVTAIVWSLRAKWWVAVLTGVLTAIGLWAMFEQGLLVQLPDGFIRGF